MPPSASHTAGPASSLAGPAAAVLAGAAGLAAILVTDPTTPGGLMPTCPSKLLFGVVCPGCGSTRSIYCLAHCDLAQAWHFNALAMIALPFLVWWFVAWTVERATGRRQPRWDRLRCAPHVVAAMTLAWLVARNLPFAPFTGLRV